MQRLYVDMPAILDAIDTSGPDAPSFFLDRQSGQVELWLDPLVSGEENEFDPEDDRHERIPQRSSHEAYEGMRTFAESLDEEDVRDRLFAALEGKGAFRRFKDVLRGAPDLEARFFAFQREVLLREALAWLKSIEIEPQYELPPLPAPQPAARPATAGEMEIGLFDMLLLGGHKTELIDGRVSRHFVASTPAEGRKVFARLARELCEHHGLGWRKRFIEGRNDYELGRMRLSVDGELVELSVAVSRATWDAFARGG